MDQTYLQIETAAGRKQLVLASEDISIGRHKDNKLVLTDHLSSRFHCVVQKTDRGYCLRDLGSSNGTRVNGKLVQAVLLNPGDVVTIGSTRLVLVLPESARPSKAAKRNNPPAIDLPEPEPGMLNLDDLEELARPATLKGPDGEELELLTDVDVIEDPQPIPVESQNLDEYQKNLNVMLEALPGSHLRATDVTILNPRGQEITVGDPDARDAPSQVELFRTLLLAGLRSRATDVHVEPRGEHYQIRLRVDGVLVDILKLPNDVGSRLVGVAKVVADVDPAQRNIIQEGHFSAQAPTTDAMSNAARRRVDYRLSFAPAVYGQKLVIRVLDAVTAPTRLPDLGLPEQVRAELAEAIEQEAGMILVCGPTGSGKTSTLYALLRSINLRERNVITIEDPVEILIADATQIPVDEKHNNSFSNILRSVLRQDPDVILVGEIRDEETAKTAMQAAITGHLVFSTVHTKDSVGTVFRLLDLGVEPYMLGQGLQLVLAQRLVRKLCPKCKSPRRIADPERIKMGPSAQGVDLIFEPRGCRACLGVGYAGRRAFFELLKMTPSLREAISRSPSLREITAALESEPFVRLGHAGFALVAEGLVSFEEVDKAVGR